MHRPTRKHRLLLKKLETKAARGGGTKKAKRLAKWAETYKSRCEDSEDKPAS